MDPCLPCTSASISKSLSHQQESTGPGPRRTSAGGGDVIEELVTDEFYEKIQVVNPIDNLYYGYKKRFVWLIKPADQLIFKRGDFIGEYYDNGLLHLREDVGSSPRQGTSSGASTGGNSGGRQLIPRGYNLNQTLMKRFLDVINEKHMFPIDDRGIGTMEVVQLVDESMSNLLEIFTCPICFEPTFPPVYFCTNSHHLCGVCRDSIVAEYGQDSIVCPVCRIPSQFEHSMVAGDVVGIFRFRCRYYNYGCFDEIKGVNFVKHCSVDCSYRPWRCYFCKTRINIRNVYEHLTSNHQYEVPLVMKARGLPAEFKFEVPINPNSNNRNRDRDQLVKIGCICIKTEGYFFVIEMEVSFGIYGWIICFAGSPTICSKYRADIEITTEYDMGKTRIEVVKNEFKDQKVISCQNEMRSILQSIVGANYPLENASMKDFSRYGGAGRFNGTIQLKIRKV